MNYVYKHLIGIQTDTQQMKFRRCEVCPATCVIFVIFLYLGFFKFESSLGMRWGTFVCVDKRRRGEGGREDCVEDGGGVGGEECIMHGGGGVL